MAEGSLNVAGTIVLAGFRDSGGFCGFWSNGPVRGC